MIEIKEVRGHAMQREFAKYPHRLYRGCPYYVPVFYKDDLLIADPKNNPAVANCDLKCWLAYRNGKVVGRIAGIIQKRYNEIQGKKCVRFSRFDCIDDQEIANALLGAVENWGKSQGMDTLHGPWGFNDQDREGLQIEGFEYRSTYASNYYYPYFETLIKNYGFEPECEWVEYNFDIPKEPDEKFSKLADTVMSRLKLSEKADSLPVKQVVKKYGKPVVDLINACYKDLDGYVPIEGAEAQKVLDSFGIIVNPRYLSVIEDVHGDVVGVGLALPSICEPLRKSNGHMTPRCALNLLRAIKHPKELELAWIAVRSDYQNRGANAVIINRILRNIIEDRIEYVESNLELVTNSAVQSQWNTLPHNLIKRRRCYKKSI